MSRKIKRVVYRLWHNLSDAGRVGYIGKDRRYPRRTNLEERRKTKECRKLYRALNKYPLTAWHVEVLASGFRTDAALNRAEMFYIKKFDSKNKGYNCTNGGEGLSGWIPSAETRAKWSKIRKGRKVSVETRSKLSKRGIGREVSAETRKKIGKAHRGKVLSEQTRRKLSESHKKENLSAATLRKMSKSSLGRTVSEETKRKISKSSLGRTVSDETKRKISDAKRGIKLSAKHKKKLSEIKRGVPWSKARRDAHNAALQRLALAAKQKK